MSKNPEYRDPVLQEAWERLEAGMNTLVKQISQGLNLEPGKVQALAVTLLGNVLAEQNKFSIIVVAREAFRLYDNPVAALFAGNEDLANIYDQFS